MDKTQKNSAKMQRTGIMADQHKEEENRNPTSSWIPKERVSLLAILDLHQDLISETTTRNDVRYLQTNRRFRLEKRGIPCAFVLATKNQPTQNPRILHQYA
jgi:hypothetical protein